jgi:hypothetical protein
MSIAERLPLTLCTKCMRQLAEGADELDSTNIRMPGQMGAEGGHVWAVYCKHNSAGAHALVAIGRRIEWTVRTPIDSLEFARLVKELPAMYAAAIAAYLDLGGELKPDPMDVN